MNVENKQMNKQAKVCLCIHTAFVVFIYLYIVHSFTYLILVKYFNEGHPNCFIHLKILYVSNLSNQSLSMIA